VTDDTAYVQDFIDRGEKIPAGEYHVSAIGVTIPADYAARAAAAGREPDGPGGHYSMGDATLISTAGGAMLLGSVRPAREGEVTGDVVLLRDDTAVYIPYPEALVLGRFHYKVPGGSGGGVIGEF
jgi:hypothetical protein